MEEVKETIKNINEPDAAERALSDALKVSFTILKWIMFLLLIFFLASGFKTVGPDEQALVLRFGKIRGIAEERVLKPGLHWILPYPIDEIIRIPVKKKVSIPIDSFWYFQTVEEKLAKGSVGKGYVSAKLDPIRDGYCLTRSEAQPQQISAGNDYNIVHSKWQLTYGISDPERFFKNVYVDMENLPSGTNYADVITKNVSPLLKIMFEDAVVTAMVYYSIDEAIASKDTIPRHVRRLLQEKLDAIGSGIEIASVQLNDVTWPRQVDEAFLAFIRVSQASPRLITEAGSYADNILNEVAGPVAGQLLSLLGKDDPCSVKQQEVLWSQLAGTAQQMIAAAWSYRSTVVETARADAEYLGQLLPEYKKHPDLVVQKIYQDAIEQVFNNSEEKMIIQPTKTAAGKELRILINRDPLLKKEKQNENKQEQKQ